MKKKAILFLILLFTLGFYSITLGQGTVRGKVTDELGEAAINAIVSLKSIPSVKVAADMDGNYSLRIPDSSFHTLIITYSGHDTIMENVRLLRGEILVKNFSLKLAGSNVMKDFVVSAKMAKARDNYMEQYKLNSSVTVDYISSETMRKTGDPNVIAAMTRVSGVSTNSGGLITIRGIGDRYVKTMINGSRIPTLDPFTNNIRLDMFPASLVDNIIVSKTASPDVSGDWAGAYLSVETKDYPDQLTVNVETSLGYNSNVTFNEILTSQYNTPQLPGFQNSQKFDHSAYTPAVLKPTQYQEMFALGLGNYFQQLGVTPASWSSTFFNLGLVQLGLLNSTQLDDPAAIAEATKVYNSTLKLQAFDILNEKHSAFSQSLPNNWSTARRRAPLNFTQSFMIGNQTRLLDQPLGYVFGFRYGSAVRYDDSSSAYRINLDKNDSVYILRENHQQSTIESNGWSALMNLAYKINANHSFSLLYMPNISGVNNVRDGFMFNRITDDYVLFKSQFYEERSQMIYQAKLENYFPNTKMKIESNVSYTAGKSSAPDFKNLQYLPGQIGGGYPIQRFSRYLTEDLLDSRVSAELPLSQRPGLSRKFKFGGAYQSLKRGTEQYEYTINLGGNNKSFDGDINQYLDLSNFAITTGNNGGVPYHYMELDYLEPMRFWDHNVGYTKTKAVFGMLDYSIVQSLRASGGLRVEDADIYTDAVIYDTLGYDASDPRRTLKPGYFREINWLPSVNLVYALKDTSDIRMNFRTNYSRTVARPSIREISGFYSYDYQLRDYVVGNIDLQSVSIDNYDIRFESYFKSGDNVSVSLFYKDFTNHIELIKSNTAFTWQNVDKSYVAGIEIEGKKELIKNLDLRANLTLIHSRSEYDQYDIQIGDDGKIIQGTFLARISRTMFGQAPYVVNGILSYKADSIGMTTSISYNIQGPKLLIPGIFEPDVFEHPRHLLDAKVSKTLGKHFTLSFTVRDIFNAPDLRAYRKDDKWLEDFERFTYGTNYILGVVYKI